ncbi:hypothetical protein BDZ45DRAFT_238620 [Acephala macrosclerotiorum]|nr:hypothetical protein BDZ45DRAFT_238620 [Acephala macrosclerotiorum]
MDVDRLKSATDGTLASAAAAAAASGGTPLRPEHRNGGEDDNTTATTPLPACQRCRKQKLRCSRELPTCKRCRNSAAICEYPQPPPDRKLLSAKRVQNAKARAQRELGSSASSLQGRQKLPDGETLGLHQASPTGIMGRCESDVSHQFRRESKPGDYRASTPPLNAVLRRTTLPSSEVAIFLIEIFFSRLYNASLLFHKATFLSDYHANKVPDFVALSIYALASIYVS